MTVKRLDEFLEDSVPFELDGDDGLIVEEVNPSPPVKVVQPDKGNGQDTAGKLSRFALTDTGNAEVFAYLFGEMVRFDHRQKRRLTYEGHRWENDRTGSWTRLGIETARQRYLSAVDAEKGKRKEIAKHALQLEDKNKMAAMLSIAECLPPIADDGETWDADPWTIGVPNGVVDLKTGALRHGRPEDRITMTTGAPYDPGATCPRWMKFLSEIFQDDVSLIDYIWRAVGYTLTGLTTEQVLFICHGMGANGKTVFLNVLSRVLQDYAYNTPFSTFELHQRSSIPSDLAALPGRRLVTASEVGEMSRLNEQRIKALTGGDPITARSMYKDFFTYTPAMKIWVAVNHKPKVTDDTYGFWRRVRMIPFLRQFTTDADRDLEKKLMAEAQGILTWEVLGCLEWQTRGLEPPAIVTDAVEDYRRESDPLVDFLTSRCIEAAHMAALSSELYGAYQEWAKEARLREREILSVTSFGRRMGAKFKKGRRENAVEYRGVGLRHA